MCDRRSSLVIVAGGTSSRGLSADGRRILVGLADAVAFLDLDADGDGVSNRDEYARGSHPRGIHRRYFAEGVSSSFFDTAV